METFFNKLLSFHKVSVKKIFLIISALLLAFSFSSCNREVASNIETSNIETSNIETSNIGNRIGNLYNAGFVAQDDKSIYYQKWEGGKSYLYKSDFKGNIKEIISEASCKYLNVIDNCIYYINGEDNNKIYKINTDGQNNQKVNDIKANFLVAYNNKLYVIGIADYNNSLYVMNYDGTNVKTICNDRISNLFLYGNYIYYSSYIDSARKINIFRTDIDGNNKESVFDDNVQKFFVYKDDIYYTTENKLCKINIIGKEKTVIQENVVIPDATMNSYGNIFYYRNMSDQTFHLINLDTGKQKVVNNVTFTNNYIINNRIFHYKNNQLYSMSVDGSDDKPF